VSIALSLSSQYYTIATDWERVIISIVTASTMTITAVTIIITVSVVIITVVSLARPVLETGKKEKREKGLGTGSRTIGRA
jgi:hypothetical protein